MKMLTKAIVFFILVIVSPLKSFAWNATGHMLIATIAYQQLTPNVKSKVDQFVNTFSKEYLDFSTIQNLSVWPDEIRSQRIESFTHWHYIDLIYNADGTTPSPNIIDTDNAVWAIKQIAPVIKNHNANVYERARFLAFLVHIVGDLHQPLHGVSRVTAAHPDGDHGGNLFHLQKTYALQANNLHSLWDSGCGVFQEGMSRENIAALANAIMTQFPKESLAAKTSDLKPENWASDDLDLAKKQVYNTAENQMPNTAYIEACKQTAQQQSALAGYRLGAMLNDLLT